MRKDRVRKTLRDGSARVRGGTKVPGVSVKQCVPASVKSRGRTKIAQYIINSALNMIVAVDKDGRIIEFNKAAQKTFGYRADEVLGKSVDILYDDPAEALVVQETVGNNGEFSGEITSRRKDGRLLRTFIAASPLRDERGQILGRIGISHDVTDFKMAEEALKESERFLSSIFDSINDPFSILDREYRIVRANGAYAQMRNKRVHDLIGRKCYEALENGTGVCPGCVVKKTFDSSDPCAKEKRLALQDGGDVWVEIYTYPILNEEGVVSHVVEYTRDITDRMKAEEDKKRLIGKLVHLSSTDVLTGLLNRRALMDRLNYEALRASRYGSALSLILCDIDYFKQVNDAYGHAAGDRVIKTVAGALRSSLRTADVVGRYGGDEFMLVLPQTSREGAEEFAERIRSSIERKGVRIRRGKSITVSLSLGVTSFECPGEDLNVNALIKRSDRALYTAKRTGRNKVCVITRA